MFNVNGRTMSEVWNSLVDYQKDAIAVAVGKTYITKRRAFVDKENYDGLSEDQKKYANVVCNQALKTVSSPWHLIKDGRNPYNDGYYWCVVINGDTAKLEQLYFGRPSVLSLGFLSADKFERKWVTTSTHKEIVPYAWLDESKFDVPLAKLPDGVSYRKSCVVN